MPQLDHLILAVNDRDQSIDFYTRILALAYDGQREPFSVIRVTPNFVIQLAPWGTKGNEHLAFSMTRAEFDAAFERIRAASLEYGDSFHSANNMKGPGEEGGAEGMGKALYLFDPNRHLIEIRHYDRD
jgi:catechol 2,3-dioxygenase-like lactoylglutathione lyase family enzyme